VRGSLLERRLRPHGERCAKCARGEGHPLWVLTVSYPRGRTRQISLRGEQVAAVRHWLRNYQELKDAIEVICELNRALLRPEPEAPWHDRGAARPAQATGMIEARRAQRSLATG
jgi:hypothetical protein